MEEKKLTYKDVPFGLAWLVESWRESTFVKYVCKDTIDESYPQRDFHTMYVGKIEKVLVRDDEYLKWPRL